MNFSGLTNYQSDSPFLSGTDYEKIEKKKNV